MVGQVDTKEIVAGFKSLTVNLEGKAGAKIPFTFVYTGPVPIESIKATCGCTDIKEKNGVITGTLALADKGSFKKGLSTTQVTKSIIAYFEDGEDYQHINASTKNLITNTRKTKVTLTINATVDLT